jgi:hypothetical protein
VSIPAAEVSVRGVRSAVVTAEPAHRAEAVVFVYGNPGPADDWRDLLIHAAKLGRAGLPKDFRYSLDGYAGIKSMASTTRPDPGPPTAWC